MVYEDTTFKESATKMVDHEWRMNDRESRPICREYKHVGFDVGFPEILPSSVTWDMSPIVPSSLPHC